jgi:AcrR family transcriptional regulator
LLIFFIRITTFPVAASSNNLKPRKSPRQARACHSVDAVIEAAAQILSQGGLAAFTTNAVAQRAGVSIGTLYQYFANKDAVMVALIDREQRARVTAVGAAIRDLPDTATLLEAVRCVVRAVIASDRANERLARVLDHEEARLPVGEVVSAALDASGQIVATLLFRHAHEVRSIQVTTASRTMPLILRAVIDGWTNGPSPDYERAEAEAVRALVGYLSMTDPSV